MTDLQALADEIMALDEDDFQRLMARIRDRQSKHLNSWYDEKTQDEENFVVLRRQEILALATKFENDERLNQIVQDAQHRYNIILKRDEVLRIAKGLRERPEQNTIKLRIGVCEE